MHFYDNFITVTSFYRIFYLTNHILIYFSFENHRNCIRFYRVQNAHTFMYKTELLRKSQTRTLRVELSTRQLECWTQVLDVYDNKFAKKSQLLHGSINGV